MTLFTELKRMPKLLEAAQRLRERYDERVEKGINDHVTNILDWAWIKASKQIIDTGRKIPFLPTCEEMDMVVEMYNDKKDMYRIYDLAADNAIKEYI